MDAACLVAAVLGEVSGEGLPTTMAPIGDGDAVDGAVDSLADGAGITVTTADGDAVRRRCVGDGAGADVGLGLGRGGSVVRLGLGSGGGGTSGDGELEARLLPAVAVGFGVALGLAFELAAGLATGLGLAELVALGAGDGLEVAACAEPSRSVGVSSVAATASSIGRGAAGTRPTLGRRRSRRREFARCKPNTSTARRTTVDTAVRAAEGTARMAADSLTLLYTAHYRGLVRLAAYLTGDPDSAEEVVQDAYVKVLGRWGGLRDVDSGATYLRQAVVNLSRSRVRHRRVVERHDPPPPGDAASAESGALTRLDRAAVVQALSSLPRRQREALVLRYYADLSEAQTAHAMGISAGAVKSHTSRGMAALRHLLEEDA